MKASFRLLPALAALAALVLAGSAQARDIRLAERTIVPGPSLSSLAAPVCKAAPDGKFQYIVQPAAKFSPADKAALAESGVVIAGLVPPDAYIILATPAAAAQVAKQYACEYLGEYLPDYKTAASFRQRTQSAAEAAEAALTCLVRVADAAYLEGLAGELKAAGVQYAEIFSSRPALIMASLPPALAEELTGRSEVLRVSEYVPATLCNDVARKESLMNVESVNDTGLDGSGLVVAVFDSGFDNGLVKTVELHPDFADKKVTSVVGKLNFRSMSNDLNGHGTHVAGSVCGAGTVSDGQFRGTAYGADLYSVCLGSSSSSIVTMTEDDIRGAYEAGARIANHSWGDASPDNHGKYLEYTEFLDTICWNSPDYLMLFAAGNNNRKVAPVGNCTISPQAAAKNVLTVGAAETDRPELDYTYGKAMGLDVLPYKNDSITAPANGEQQGMAAFSSHGPTHDERFKPELVAPGTFICSTQSISDPDNKIVDGKRTSYYKWMSGTSQATPLTCGAAVCAYQYLQNLGLEAPSSALLKAVLINGTRSMGRGQYAGYTEIPEETPNSVNGFGHVNLGASLFPEDSHLIVVEGVVSNDGEVVTYNFRKDQNGPVRATLVWTDYPATVGSGRDLVNDLDIQVFDGMMTYYANGFNTHNDSLNNCETYREENFLAGDEIEIRVHAYNLMEGPQPFALAITGMDEGPIPEPCVLGLAALALALGLRRRNR